MDIRGENTAAVKQLCFTVTTARHAMDCLKYEVQAIKTNCWDFKIIIIALCSCYQISGLVKNDNYPSTICSAVSQHYMLCSIPALYALLCIIPALHVIQYPSSQPYVFCSITASLALQNPNTLFSSVSQYYMLFDIPALFCSIPTLHIINSAVSKH